MVNGLNFTWHLGYCGVHYVDGYSTSSSVTLFYCLPLQDSYSYVRSTAPAVAYDSKQYYQQPTATAAVAAAQPQPSVADSYYQTGMLQTHSLHFHSLITFEFMCPVCRGIDVLSKYIRKYSFNILLCILKKWFWGLCISNNWVFSSPQTRI